MRKRSITMSLVIAGLAASSAIARTPPGAGQQLGAATTQGPTPIFRVTVVGHVTPAINYRPRKGDTEIDFRGTPLMPLAIGEAKVQGKRA